MVEVTKTNMLSKIWKNFYDRLKSDVTTLTGLGCEMPDGTHTATIQNYTNSFPDKDIDKKSSYPLLIIETPNISTESFTLQKDQVNGTINIEIYTNQSETADKFMEEIINSIETYRGDFASVGLHNIKVDSTNSDSAQRDQIKVHVRGIVFSFVFRYERTRSW